MEKIKTFVSNKKNANSGTWLDTPSKFSMVKALGKNVVDGKTINTLDPMGLQNKRYFYYIFPRRVCFTQIMWNFNKCALSAFKYGFKSR